MTSKTAALAALAILPPALFAQADTSTATDFAEVSVVRAPQPLNPLTIVREGLFALSHPVHMEARHPRSGCLVTAACGEVFWTYDTHNIRVSQGTTWQSQLMGDTSTPTHNVQCNYLALTNTAVTPAMADTSLSGEITSNGLARAQGTYTDSSGTISVPAAPTVTVNGTAASTSYWYWVSACGQGICTTLSSAGTTTTANATLSATNFDQVSWAPVSGATTYYVLRTTSSSAPTGAQTAIAGRYSTSQPDCSTGTCYLDDIANAAGGASFTVPASNLTNYGHFTLVHTWTASAGQSAQAFGVFWDSTQSDSAMCFEGTFTPVSLNTNDTFQLTETIQF